jgi:hypothetical protein
MCDDYLTADEGVHPDRFSTSLDGARSAFNPPADVGTKGIWSTASATPTPEPSAPPVIGICLAGVIFFRRQRMKASQISGSLPS